MPRSHVLPDYLAPDLRAVFVGTSVGVRSAAVRHYYAGTGNEFWAFLAASRLTTELLGPERDAEILTSGLGLTDLAKRRVSSSDAALARSDFDVRAFVAKIEHFAPGWVAFHGKGAAVEVSRALGHGRVVHLGRQQWRVGSSRVFVLPSASGSNRSLANLEGEASRLGWFREFRRVLPRPTATVVKPEAQAARSEQLAGADTHPLSFDDNG